MSHVAIVKAAIKADQLDQFEQALVKLGGELRRGQTSFQMYGREKQPCVHTARVKGAKAGSYEIGLRYAEASDAEADRSFDLACDFFDGSLTRAFGDQLGTLKAEYAAVVAEDVMRRDAYMVGREETPTHIYLTCRA